MSSADPEGRHPDPWSGGDLDAFVVVNLMGPGTGIFFVKDLEGRFLRVSADCAALVGRTPEEMIGLTDFDLTDHAHATELRADELRIIATGEPLLDKEEVDRLANRTGTWVETSKFPLRAADGTIIGTFGQTRDVSRWELAERRLALVEAQLRAVLNGSMDAIGRYDRDLTYQYANPAGERFKRASLEELRGRTDRETGMPEEWLEVYEPALQRVRDTGEPEEIEFPGYVTGDVEGSWFHVSLSPDRDASGEVVGVLVSVRDISEIKQAERALKRQALHDPLTGLANRVLLMDRLSAALVHLQRHRERLALFFIDIDFFKEFNDGYGHEVGDRVLVEVARRLQGVMRAEDTVARLGGDEYIVLCAPLLPDDVRDVANRIVTAIGQPFDEGSVLLPVSASVGAVVTGDPTATAAQLLHEADSAMYRAKIAGRNGFVVAERPR